jgi:hypothetical protein
VTLSGFDIESGKIPLSMLDKLSKQFLRLSEKTLLSYLEGSSQIKRGKNPEWLCRLLDFQLTGINPGSTQLEIEAPLLQETLENIQLPVFSDLSPEEIMQNSALGFSLYAYEQASNHNLESFILDKEILKEILHFKDFFESEKAQITVSTPTRNKTVTFNYESINKIKTIEEHTPQSIRAKISGKLDVMKHTRAQLEIISGQSRIQASLGENLNIERITEYFGKNITATGIASYKPSRQIKSFEIQSLSLADQKDVFFEKPPVMLFEEMEVQRYIKEQKYKGTDFSKIIGKWPGEESIDELLQQLDK